MMITIGLTPGTEQDKMNTHCSLEHGTEFVPDSSFFGFRHNYISNVERSLLRCKNIENQNLNTNKKFVEKN